MKALHQPGCLCFSPLGMCWAPAASWDCRWSQQENLQATWHPTQGAPETSPLAAHPSPDTVLGTLRGTQAQSQTLMYLWNSGCATGN